MEHNKIPKLIIIRGIPGSGKSTYAKEKYPEYMYSSADEYFYINNVYKYDKTKIKDAHDYCFLKVKFFLENGKDSIVANTFSSKTELFRYIKYFENKAEIKIIHMTNKFDNIHNIPENLINKIENNFYDYENEIKISTEYREELKNKDVYNSSEVIVQKEHNEIYKNNLKIPMCSYIKKEKKYELSEKNEKIVLESNTIKTYNSRIKKLEEIGIFVNENFDVEYMINKLNKNRKIETNNNSKYTYNTICSYISAVIYEINKKNIKNELLLNSLKEKLTIYTIKQSKKQKEILSSKIIEWEKILKLQEELSKNKNKSFENLTDYTLLLLYSEIPPKRNNYAEMKIIQKRENITDDTLNYYISEEKIFILNDYKTSKEKNKNNTDTYIHTSQYINIEDNVDKILKEYINHKNNKIVKKGILFSNKKFITRHLIKILKNIEPDISSPIDTLRHSYATFISKNMNDLKDIDKHINIIKQMDHLVETNVNNYVHTI